MQVEERRVDLAVGPLPISGRRPGAEEAARRKGRSALLRARGLRGLRATSRSFGLAADFGFRVGMAVLAPDDVR